MGLILIGALGHTGALECVGLRGLIPTGASRRMEAQIL